MKIYRIWGSRTPDYTMRELAFLSSFKAACDYIKAQLKDAEEIAGYLPGANIWTHDEKKFAASLKEGYKWGKMSGAYMTESYAIEIITVEN